jgi:hypothetical protein
MNEDPSLYRFLDLGSSSKSQSLSPQHQKPIQMNKNLPQNHSPHQRPRASIDYVPLPASLLERLAAEQEFMNAKNPKPPTQHYLTKNLEFVKNTIVEGLKNKRLTNNRLTKAWKKYLGKQEPNFEISGSTPPDQRKGYAVGGKTLKNKKPIKKPSNGLKIMPKPPSKPKKVKAKIIKPIYR